MPTVTPRRKAEQSFARKLLRLQQRRERLIAQQRVMAVAIRQVEERMMELEEEATADA